MVWFHAILCGTFSFALIDTNCAALESPWNVDSKTPLTFCFGTKTLASTFAQVSICPRKVAKKWISSCINFSVAANGATNSPSAPLEAPLNVDEKTHLVCIHSTARSISMIKSVKQVYFAVKMKCFGGSFTASRVVSIHAANVCTTAWYKTVGPPGSNSD